MRRILCIGSNGRLSNSLSIFFYLKQLIVTNQIPIWFIHKKHNEVRNEILFYIVFRNQFLFYVLCFCLAIFHMSHGTYIRQESINRCAHVQSDLGCLFCLRHLLFLFRSRTFTNLQFFLSEKTHFPSYLRNMF